MEIEIVVPEQTIEYDIGTELALKALDVNFKANIALGAPKLLIESHVEIFREFLRKAEEILANYEK